MALFFPLLALNGLSHSVYFAFWRNHHDIEAIQGRSIRSNKIFFDKVYF